MIQAAALVAACACVLTYLGMIRLGWPMRTYHWVNVCSAPVIGVAAFVVGAWGSLFVTVSYGLVALIGLVARDA